MGRFLQMTSWASRSGPVAGHVAKRCWKHCHSKVVLLVCRAPALQVPTQLKMSMFKRRSPNGLGARIANMSICIIVSCHSSTAYVTTHVLCVCVYVCLCVCVYVCLFVCHVYTYVCIYCTSFVLSLSLSLSIFVSEKILFGASKLTSRAKGRSNLRSARRMRW